jgi:hypothetical protein
MLMPFDIPPGVYRTGTDYQSRGRYFDADLWRFHEGTSRPVGGWVARSLSPLSGAARAAISWQDNSNQPWTGVGTHTHLYAVSRSGGVSDITPVGLPAGYPDALVGGGYGDGLYGMGLYGTPRLGSDNIIPASVWSLDTWGEYLVGTMGATIYEWQTQTGTPAAAISGAPEAEAILVTDERIMMALASDGDPRAVDWCDAEDNTDWTPTATNLAGGKRLQTNGSLKAGKRVNGAYLLLTDTDAHRATYVGLPFVYSFTRLETGCGVASKGAAVLAADGRVYWMGVNGFWNSDGSFVDPVPCEVFDYVFGDLNRTQISKVTTLHNSLFHEVWWWYPSAASDENDRYVYFKYLEGQQHWMIGEMARLAAVDRGVLTYPQAVDADGVVYSHETGNVKDGRQPFLISGPVEMGAGDRLMWVSAYIPDETTLGEVSVSFSVRDWTMDSAFTVPAITASAKTDVRFQGRAVSVTYTGEADEDFRLGSFRFDVKPGSRR